MIAPKDPPITIPQAAPATKTQTDMTPNRQQKPPRRFKVKE
jgi:hypothetical protein